ncbi:ArdC family protein [Micromonospora sp. NPDC004336]
MATRRGTSPSDNQREQWAAERRAKLAELHERVVAEVGKITDSDQWRRWLQFAAKFHGYSFNNVLLIMAQRPDATWVAGYKRWKTEFGRHVRKGEKGIAILAPVTKRVTDDPQESPEDRSEPTKHDPQVSAVKQNAQSARVLHTFKPVAVFDISQTEGPDIDVPGGPAFADVMPQLLEGQAPAGLYDQLVMLAEERGYTVERGDCRGANGFTDYTNRLIRVRDDVDDAQAVKTMIHELGHVDLHTPSDFGWETTRGCRGEREVEAESVAFLVAERYGLDTSTYTFAYVALWAQRAAEQTGQSPEGIVQAVGQRIVASAPPHHRSRRHQPHPRRRHRRTGAGRPSDQRCTPRLGGARYRRSLRQPCDRQHRPAACRSRARVPAAYPNGARRRPSSSPSRCQRRHRPERSAPTMSPLRHGELLGARLAQDPQPILRHHGYDGRDGLHRGGHNWTHHGRSRREPSNGA